MSGPHVYNEDVGFCLCQLIHNVTLGKSQQPPWAGISFIIYTQMGSGTPSCTCKPSLLTSNAYNGQCFFPSTGWALRCSITSVVDRAMNESGREIRSASVYTNISVISNDKKIDIEARCISRTLFLKGRKESFKGLLKLTSSSTKPGPKMPFHCFLFVSFKELTQMGNLYFTPIWNPSLIVFHVFTEEQKMPACHFGDHLRVAVCKCFNR